MYEQFKEICGFNPMEHCITIASACNVAYRKNWMPENKIAVEPVRGWRPNHIQSHATFKWLYYKESKLTKTNLLPRIAHARNKRERRIVHGKQTYLVDGYDSQTKTIYEFQGCFYHGCLTCFPNRTMKHPFHQNKTMQIGREETRSKIQQLTALGYHVKEMWESEWNRMIETVPKIKEFVEKVDIVTPQPPRRLLWWENQHHQITSQSSRKRRDPLQRHDIIVPMYKFGMPVPYWSSKIHRSTWDYRHH